jgi:hypothetical protein
MTSSPYILFYVARRRKTTTYKSLASPALPPGLTLVTEGRIHHNWWYLELNDGGVYQHSALSRVVGNPHINYQQWGGQFPDNWIDRSGNLRDHEGRVIFVFNP